MAAAFSRVIGYRPPPPPVRQNIGNTVSPVVCSGPAHPATRPFLVPPFHGFVRLYTYFDHDYPDFAKDGRIVLANGMTITRPLTDGSEFSVASDFPAYWSQSLRQYVEYDGHNGYDYDLYYQPVYAAARGTVIFAGWNVPGSPRAGYGQAVIINHGNGYSTLYGHLSRLLVKYGQTVRQGQEIGISGNTGASSGPHLHFSVFHNCDPTDPYGWTGAGADPLQTYQGETSAYLWLRPPHVLNPFPNFPGNRGLPAPTLALAAKLKLPSTTSLVALLTQLQRERQRVSRILVREHLPVFYDDSAGAFLFPRPVPVSRLYALPDVASVVPDSMQDLSFAQTDFAGRMAQLLNSVAVHHWLKGGQWRASVFRFGGMTYLLGHGPSNRTVAAHLGGRKGLTLETTSNARGGFVVPLVASLSPRVRITLESTAGKVALLPPHASEAPVHGKTGSSQPPDPPVTPTRSPRTRSPEATGRKAHPIAAAIYVVGPIALTVAALLGVAGLWLRRKLLSLIS